MIGYRLSTIGPSRFRWWAHDAGDGSEDAREARLDEAELFATCRRQPVIPGATVVHRVAPLGDDPPLELHPLQSTSGTTRRGTRSQRLASRRCRVRNNSPPASAEPRARAGGSFSLPMLAVWPKAQRRPQLDRRPAAAAI